MFCRCCGRPIDKYDKYCIYCGEKVVVGQQAPPTYPVVQNASQETKWALIVGIIALVISGFQPLAGFILGIIAIVRSNKEKRKAAMILGVIAIVICVFSGVIGIIYETVFKEIFEEIFEEFVIKLT
ncbi:MAG TPA: hypothetical protein VIL26_02450 [Clostridia bacterium]